MVKLCAFQNTIKVYKAVYYTYGLLLLVSLSVIQVLLGIFVITTGEKGT